MLPSDAGDLLERFEAVERRRRILWARYGRRRRAIARLEAETPPMLAEIRACGVELAELRKKLCT